MFYEKTKTIYQKKNLLKNDDIVLKNYNIRLSYNTEENIMFARLPKCSDKYTGRFRISTFVTIPQGPLAVKKKNYTRPVTRGNWLTCLLLKEKLSKILNSVAARPAPLYLL